MIGQIPVASFVVSAIGDDIDPNVRVLHTYRPGRQPESTDMELSRAIEWMNREIRNSYMHGYQRAQREIRDALGIRP